MKKIILIALVLLCKAWVSNAQQFNMLMPETKTTIDSNVAPLQLKKISLPDDGIDHLQKSRNKRTTALVFLGGGAICTAIGVGTFPKSYDAIWGYNSERDEKKADVASAFIIAGIAFMVSSIPYFVSSSVHKRKAGFKMSSQNTGFAVPSKAGKHITGIALVIPIGN